MYDKGFELLINKYDNMFRYLSELERCEMILGLDLSIASTGYCVFDKENDLVAECGTIKTDSKDSTPIRLNKIRCELAKIKSKYNISEVVIERGFTRFNKATQMLYRVHGIANELFWEYKQTYYAPTTIKKEITGKGNASKELVMQKVNELFPDVVSNDDESDSLALIITHLKKK